MNHQARIALTAVLVIAAGLMPRLVLAGEADDQLIVVHDMLVAPGQAGDVEAYLKGLTAQMQAHRYPYTVAVYKTLDLRYCSFISIRNYAEIDNLHKALADLRTKMGTAAFDSLAALRDRALQQDSWLVWRRLADASYVPGHPRNPPDEEVFRHWILMYPAAGKTEAMLAILRRFRDIYVKTQLPSTEIVYVAETGTDLPLIIGEERAKSYFDFYGFLEQGFKIIGEEGSRLWWQEATLVLRKLERRDGVYRPDLSFFPTP